MKYQAGVLPIHPAFIAELLCIPKGNDVIETRIDLSGTIYLTLQGPNMPETATDKPPPRVMVICKTETRPGDLAKGGTERRVTGWFAHDPEKTWIMRDWHRLND